MAALFGVTCAGATAQEAKPSCVDDAMLVFDASGSMAATDFPDGAPSRMDRVRQALFKVLPAAARARRLGLMVYGPGRNSDTCKNVDLRLAPAANAGERIMKEVDGLRPQGRTALTTSVQQAAELLHRSDKPAVIVALTDGQDTCGGDACRLARELKSVHPTITVHVIGYRLKPMTADAEPPFVERCLADETGGIFATAETTDQLASALSETLGCPAVTALPGSCFFSQNRCTSRIRVRDMLFRKHSALPCFLSKNRFTLFRKHSGTPDSRKVGGAAWALTFR